MNPLRIADTFVALDDSCGARPLPVTADFWEKMQSGQLGQFPRMISYFAFDQDWNTWEKHPAGEEFVCLLTGDVALVLEQPNGKTVVTLNEPGSYVLVPANTWHTAKVRSPSKMLFVTPGNGTEVKPA